MTSNPNLHIVIGTVTGTAQSVARFIDKKLQPYFNIQRHEYPDLNEILTESQPLILFCVSNTGVGELPPGMRKIYVQLTEEKRNLQGYEYLLINFGDSSFKTYGKSGETLENALNACGAKNLAPRLTIDAMLDRYPRQTAMQWLNDTLLDLGKITSI